MLMRALCRQVSPRGSRGRLSVLIFHRVLPKPDPLFPDETDAQSFDQVCTWLRDWFNVLPLDEAVLQMRSASLPERALAITFDDGYADNHDVALPILRRHGLTATFFIATGFLDGGRMWNDTVIESVRHSSKSGVDLTSLGEAGLISLSLGSLDERRSAIDTVIRAIKYLPPDKRIEIAEQIASRLGVSPPSDLMMTSGEVRALRRAGMQIGAHTVNHPILARLDDGAARREIGGSKRFLEELLDEPVGLFAYPNGKPGEDFTPDSVALARDLGFDAAVSTAWGAASRATDPFQIPRFTPWDKTKYRFGARLVRNLWSAAEAS